MSGVPDLRSERGVVTRCDLRISAQAKLGLAIGTAESSPGGRPQMELLPQVDALSVRRG